MEGKHIETFFSRLAVDVKITDATHNFLYNFFVKGEDHAFF